MAPAYAPTERGIASSRGHSAPSRDQYLDQIDHIDTIHAPVLLTQCLDLLAEPLSRPDAIYVDGTLGMAGHTQAVLDRFPTVTVVGIDRDAEALALAKTRLDKPCYRGRVVFVHSRFDGVADALDAHGIDTIDGMLLDLGLSSWQIDQRERGFSYSANAPLDMRMNPADPLTAADVINTYPVQRLAQIMMRYGDERNAKRIATAIAARREHHPITTSAELVEVIEGCVRGQQRSGHPAKRVFQALRIEVNGELDALANVLPIVTDRLALGGRLVVMSYHSGEDRLVKRYFAECVTDRVPNDMPIVPSQYQAQFALCTRGAVKPDEAECAGNPRARSAKLRALERIKPKPPHLGGDPARSRITHSDDDTNPTTMRQEER